jgi:hypothetical protein
LSLSQQQSGCNKLLLTKISKQVLHTEQRERERYEREREREGGGGVEREREAENKESMELG